MRYFTVTSKELMDARPGLELIERLIDADSSRIDLYLFVTTTKETVLLAAGDVLGEDLDPDAGEVAPSVNELALAIRLSSDLLYRLTGQGYLIKREDFAYRAGRDDVRTHWMGSPNGVTVTMTDFDTMALADSDTWLDEFLKEYGVNTGAVDADITIPRTEPAVTPAPDTKAASKRGQTKKAGGGSPAPVYTGLNLIDNFLA